MTKKVLILASVASMIDQFNMPNINLLIDMKCKVHVACNFEEGSTCSSEQIERLKSTLESLEIEYYQIDFKRNVMKMPSNIAAYKQVHNLMKSNKYEFAHCHSPIGGVIGRLAGNFTDTKIIYTAHGFHFYKGAPLINWLVYYPIEKWLSRCTDMLITINKEDYERAKGFKAKKVEYVPGVGIDIGKFNDVKVDRVLKREELGLPENSFVILSVGELNKNKNHEVVIKAIAKINKRNIHYVICGQGELEGYLRDLSIELGIEKNVHLLGFRKDVDEIYKVADLFAFPSFREGLSVALMEAMANGLPVVCSNIRGNSDLIEDKKGGYLVEPNDAGRLSQLIIRVCESEELRNDFSKKNREMIKGYSIEEILKIMEAVYSVALKNAEDKGCKQ